MAQKINWEALREALAKEPEKVLAAIGLPPFVQRYSEEERKKLRETLGLPDCLLSSFILDVLLPPPFRPPLMLIACLIGG
jgi:hypothetical protein